MQSYNTILMQLYFHGANPLGLVYGWKHISNYSS